VPSCTYQYKLKPSANGARISIVHAQEQQSQGTPPGTRPRMQRLIERSVFSDRMVFVRAVHNAKWMSELELQVYDSWFNPIVSALPTVR
jgi:Deoxynucleoside kinase